MAENTFTTLANRQGFKVTDKGTELTFTLPEWLPTDEVYESEEALIDFCAHHEITHAIMQAGIRAMIIDLRACARPSGKNQQWEQSEAQERIDNFVCKPQERPKARGKATPEDALATLKASGMSAEEILAMLSAG